ncbi:MAG: hypothetical protein ACXW2U_08970 [Telluria sp.]
MMSLLERAQGIVLPWWAKWLALAAMVIAVYGTGRLHEARRSSEAMTDYLGKQVKQSAVIVKKQTEVQTSVQTKYVDRIKKIYVQGATIETSIPQFIHAPDTDRFGVNVGFVRVVDAAWSGNPAGSPEDSDRGPADIPLDDVAAVQAGNATSCHAWREQALGWREFYARQQIAINTR